MAETVRIDGNVVVVGGEAHPHALRRLREELPGRVIAEGAGSLDRPLRITLKTASERAEGWFAIRTVAGEAPEIVIEGGPFSGVIYGVEELLQRQIVDGAVEVGTHRTDARASLSHLLELGPLHQLGTEQIGVQEIGVMNPYTKPPDGFLADFKRVVDFMSRNRIAAIAIYGFLRDSHGGIAAAQELCRYANERGVRIMPGVAINAYGGVVWEMDHDFNLATWLRGHPELAAEMERPAGFQIQDLGLPALLPAWRLQRARVPLQAREPALDGRGYRLAGGDIRDRRNQHRGRRLRRLRMRAVPGAPGGPGGADAPPWVRRESGRTRTWRISIPGCSNGAVKAAGCLDLLRDPVGQPARRRGEAAPAQPARTMAFTSTP